MALNIKSPQVERLAAEIAQLTGESKTEAIRRALEQRKAQLALQLPLRDRERALARFLEREVWPAIPPRLKGKRLSRRERERILGYGPEGA